MKRLYLVIQIVGFVLAAVGIYAFYEFSKFVNNVSHKSARQKYNTATEFVADGIFDNINTQLNNDFNNDVLVETLSTYPFTSTSDYDRICSSVIGQLGLKRIFIAERADNEMEVDTVL